MNIGNDYSQLKPIEANKPDFAPNKQVSKKTETAAFSGVFDAAIGVLNKTNEEQVKADKAQIDFATGKNDDMLSVMLAQEKAYTTLNFTVQATNRVLEAYKEIMRLQI